MYNKGHVALMLLAQRTDRILRNGVSLAMLVIALVLSPVLTVLALVLIARRSIRAISYQTLSLPFSKRVADAMLVGQRPFQSQQARLSPSSSLRSHAHPQLRG
jgi:hypothetical protein